MTLIFPKIDKLTILPILITTLLIIIYNNRDYLKSLWKDIFKGKWGNSERAETFYKIYALYIVLSIIRLIIWYYEYLIK